MTASTPALEQPESTASQRRGVLMLAAAALLFSVMSALVKRSGRDLPVEMLVLARGVVTLVLSYAVLRQQRISVWGNDRARLLLRGVFGMAGLACFFFAVTRLRLTEVTVIHYLNPLLTALLAAVLLRERIGWSLAAAIALSIVGMLLVTRPPFIAGFFSAEANAAVPPLDPAGLAAALGGAAFAACAYVTVRRLRKTDHPHVIVFYFPLVAVPITLPFALAAWVWPSPLGWLLLLAIGVVTQFAQVLLTRGLALLPAGRAMTVGYLQIVFAALWGIVFFDELLSGWTVLGALLIVAASATLATRRKNPAATPSRE